MSIYSKKFLAIDMVFLEFAHILLEAIKPLIVLTDNKSVTRYFQTKVIPPSLWNACDYVLHFNFKKAHVADSVNTAAELLSRLELKVTEKNRLRIREDRQLRSKHPPQMLQMKNNSPSHRQMLKTRLKKKTF